jgi:hypothetical protein
MRFALFILAAIFAGISFSVQAKMYKWVDDNGQIHFGDRIPPQYLVKEHEELNQQGVVTRYREAAKTPQQLAEEKRLEEERKKAEIIAKRKKQRDQVLLDTYTTERDLIVARDSRLDAVDSQIRLAVSIIKDSNNKIEAMERQIAQIKASNRDVPADMYKRIDIEKQQVTLQSRVMKDHKKHRDEISVQFNDYIERFQALKAEQKVRREALARKRGEME